MKSSRKRSAYLRRVGESLSVCQLIEAILKVYIQTSFSKIHDAVDSKVPFRFSGKDYASAPLESLLKVFKKLSDHDALIKRLDSFKDERNYLAHRAMMEYLHEANDSPKKHRALLKRLSKIKGEGYVLLKELLVEVKRLEMAPFTSLYKEWPIREVH